MSVRSIIEKYAELFDRHFEDMASELGAFHVEHCKGKAEPDPITESPLYKKLIHDDIHPDLARVMIKAVQDNEQSKAAESHPLANISPLFETENEPDRLAVIAEIFSDMPTDADTKAWEAIKRIENKFGKDDIPGFDDVYPAIKKAAERLAGKVSLSEFLDVDKVKANQAPWDVGLPAGADDEAALMADIQKMLNELAPYSGRKDCQVGNRTSERQEDGSIIHESIAAYHKRVQGKVNQLHNLKYRGVIE